MQDVIILEAQHHEACSTQQGVARELGWGSREVGSTIGFDDQARLFTEEVDDVRPQGLLPAELGPFEPAAAQQ
jgi:hypothetical protein